MARQSTLRRQTLNCAIFNSIDFPERKCHDSSSEVGSFGAVTQVFLGEGSWLQVPWPSDSSPASQISVARRCDGLYQQACHWHWYRGTRGLSLTGWHNHRQQPGDEGPPSPSVAVRWLRKWLGSFVPLRQGHVIHTTACVCVCVSLSSQCWQASLLHLSCGFKHHSSHFRH